jgi:hypothetical protein
VLTLLSLPAALGLALRALFRGQAPDLAVAGLSASVLAAAALGLTLALQFDGLRALVGSVRRANRAREGSSLFAPSITADAVADVFGNSASPALQLTVKALAAAALVVAPLLL